MLKLQPKGKQIEGINFMLGNEKCLNASQCGTGKTLQTLAVIDETGHKAIVICPAYLKDNWAAEIEKFTSLSYYIYMNKNKSQAKMEADILIFSYTQLKNIDAKAFRGRKILAMDEVHYLKNLEAGRTESAHELLNSWRPRYVFGLSGTPIKNRVPEFFSLLCLVSYGDAKGIHTDYSYHQFCNTFCNRSEFRVTAKSGRSHTIAKYSGIKNKELLRSYLKGKYIQLKLEDIVTLDEPLESFLTVNYKDERDLSELWTAHNSQQSYDSTLKKESALLKVDFTYKYIKDLSENQNTPIVVFTCHPDVCEKLAEKLKSRVGIITGKTDTKLRFKIVESFQNGELDYLICTIGAASTGFNMTRAQHLVFNDMDWVPAENYQAKSRVQRMGQTGRVHFHYINGSKTDAMITKNLIAKEKVISEVLDGV